MKIATDYLFPKYMREISLKEMVLTPEGIKKIVDYSSNGLDKKGVRDLERYINLVIEKIYFYSCNRNGSYEYPWYKKINENVDVETGKIILSEQLVESILKENLKEKDGRYVYLNMYM